MIAVQKDGKDISTPQKRPLAVPTKALADAIADEWKAGATFNAARMPLSTLAFTAIDRVEGNIENGAEILLAYIDTDTLCYRASASDALKKRQQEAWDPLLIWAGAKFNAVWQSTSGVMPLEQPEALHNAVREYLCEMNAFRLTACTVLASHYSSVILALAVLDGRLEALAAFELSRLEEAFQNEQWGTDEAAVARSARVREDVSATARFLRLLDVA